MPNQREKLVGVPTNIITGFLGVGKTSAILHLLNQKPAGERWAVLINEFGEVGVDGSLVQGQSGALAGIYVKEVPGGCMCCAAGLPMQIALNLLLQTARPHRLLIEPTGLGHPIEVIKALSAEHYREVLSLQKVLTLLDARKLRDERYTSHPTFNQQLEIADVIVANKEDTYEHEDRTILEHYVQQHSNPCVELQVTRQGKINLDSLQGKPTRSFEATSPHRESSLMALATDLSSPTNGQVTATNFGEGFASKGWRFSPDRLFNKKRLLVFLRGLQVERMKAVFITSIGIFGYNLADEVLTELEIDDCMESRIEIIAIKIDPSWDQKLNDCLENEK